MAGDMWVIGESGDGDEALSLVEDARPDLIILGLTLVGETDGAEIWRRLKVLPGLPRVLVHTVYNFTNDVSSRLLAGAEGYTRKSTYCEELLKAIRRTALARGLRLVGKVGSRALACAPPRKMPDN